MGCPQSGWLWRQPMVLRAFFPFLTLFLELPVIISSAFAQSVPAAGGGDMASILGGPLPMLVIMLVAMYFLIIRPQQKKAKETRAMLDALAKGDEIVTAGGILGKVTKLGDSHLGLEVADGVELQVQRSAIVQVLPKGSIK